MLKAHINSGDPSPECYKEHCTAVNAEEGNSNEKNVDENYPIDETMPTPASGSCPSDEEVQDIEQQNSVDHDEVAIPVDDNDEIIAHSSQITDYRC